MPRSASILTSTIEWREFGAWLEAKRLAAGLPKKAISRALGVNNRQINDYIRGTIPPAEKTVRALAKSVNIPERAALLKAGYLRAIILELPPLLELAHHYCEVDGYDFEQCISGARIPQKQDDHYMAARIPIGSRDAQRYVVPWPAVAAINLGLMAFPLRGESYRAEYRPIDAIALHFDLRGASSVKRAGKPPREITQAILHMGDSSLDGINRRAVCGEYMRTWVRKVGGKYARLSEELMYTPAIVPPLEPSEHSDA